MVFFPVLCYWKMLGAQGEVWAWVGMHDGALEQSDADLWSFFPPEPTGIGQIFWFISDKISGQGCCPGHVMVWRCFFQCRQDF